MTQVLRMTLRRVLLLVPLLLGVALVVFLVAQIMPGDPASSALGVFADNDARQRFIEANHLNDSVWIRYPRFLGQLLHGDLGVSLVTGQPVRKLVLDAMPVTIQLTALALGFAAVVALLAGVWSALHQGGIVDGVVRVFSMAGLAMPSFWVGLMLIEFVGIKWHWLPPTSYEPPSAGLGPWLRSLLLPAISLGLGVACSLTRVVRASVLEELQKDYVRTARGAGLPPRVVIGNLLRNALLTPLTVLGLRVGAALSGAVVVETIFSVPGMGLLLINSVDTGDLSIVQGLVLIGTALYIIVNLIVDVLYLMLNPKIREA